jgi:hypothetical protein
MFGRNNNFTSITINGQTINCSGSNITISNGKVIIDGKTIQSDMNGNVHVEIHGDVENIQCGGSVTVHGNVSGCIDCGATCNVDGYVNGNVDAGNSVNCGDVTGDVDAGNSVHCGNISGDVDAGGHVSMRRD